MSDLNSPGPGLSMRKTCACNHVGTRKNAALASCYNVCKKCLSAQYSTQSKTARHDGEQQNKWDQAPSKHQIKECFMLFDKSGEGKIPRSDLAMCLRSLRCKPTNREVDEIAHTVLGSRSQFGVPELETCVERAFNLPQKTEEDFNEALKVFDRDSSGSLHVPELRHVLGNLGEKLGENEMKEFLQYCDSDMIAIDDFTAKLFSSGNM